MDLGTLFFLKAHLILRKQRKFWKSS